MNVDRMRKIDYYAGVPLTFFATLLVRGIGLVIRRARVKPKNVLLIELSEMGSAILVDPAMQKLKREADANLFFCIFASNKPSLELLGTVPDENIFTIREKSIATLALDSLRFLFWTRRRKIDTVMDLELFSRYTALLTGLSGARNRVGYYGFHNEGLYRGEMLTHRVAYNPHQHIARNFIALVNASLAENPETPYSKTRIDDDEIVLRTVEVPENEKQQMREKIHAEFPQFDAARQRVVLINPNASELLPQRRWMPDRYVELAQRILDRFPDVLLLLTGAPSERDEADDLRRRIDRDRCVNFAGRLKLKELPTLYSVSRLMVTNDSGPGHFSSITPLRTFVLFGPETPALYGSLGNSTPIYAGLACSPCVSAANHRKTACTDNVCLQAITVDQVFAEVEAELAG
ncbi:MAG: glycosyltransferase family 9 protein [Acidiferrobacteraceae bacterium]|jgi:ADP-heptose:LPS heptosyltransferase